MDRQPTIRRPQGGLAASSRRAYAADWALFADWCIATGRTSLPATVDTVIAFLDDNPATPATWRRRVTAIDHTHAAHDHSPPGHDPAVVDMIRAAAGQPAVDTRSARMDEGALAELLERIPTHGWPAGLVGRRDRLLLVLHAAGLTHRQLQQLRADDLEITGQVLMVRPGGDGEPVDISAGRWGSVLPVRVGRSGGRSCTSPPNHPGIRTIRDAFWRTPTAPTAFGTDHRHGEAVGPGGGRVFGPIDRYGYLDRRTPLSLRAISHRLARYHRGDIPTFRYQDPPAPPEQQAACRRVDDCTSHRQASAH